ncbi:hypothetical protein ACH5RR_033752 [Cinchona calisaya]|uniref:Uncharacterized protein n=1 Tax=Cinchona calisaya TaxID=153742 RepID=A0ABD2YA54_9GENT
MHSGKDFADRYMEDIILGKLKRLGDDAEEPFVLEAVLPTGNSSDDPFVLGIPSFELDMPEPVIIELPKQLRGVGIIEINCIRLRKVHSGKDFADQYMEDIMLGKLKRMGDDAEEPFVLEAVLPAGNSSDDPFALGIPYFELDMPKLVIIELPKQLRGVGIIEISRIRLRKMHSGKDFVDRYMEDIMLRKLKRMGDDAEEPFVLEAVLPTANSSDDSFVLGVPSFERDMPELVIIELPKQLSVMDMIYVHILLHSRL